MSDQPKSPAPSSIPRLPHQDSDPDPVPKPEEQRIESDQRSAARKDGPSPARG